MRNERPDSISDWLRRSVDQEAVEWLHAIVDKSSDSNLLKQVYKGLADLFGDETALRVLVRFDDLVPSIDITVARNESDLGETEREMAFDRLASRICKKWKIYPSLKHLLLEEARERGISLETIKEEKIKEALILAYGECGQPRAHRFGRRWLKGGDDDKQLQMPLEKLDLPYAWYRLQHRTMQIAEEPFKAEHKERRGQSEAKSHERRAKGHVRKPGISQQIDPSLWQELLDKYATSKERAVLEEYYLKGQSLIEAARRHHMSPATARVHKRHFQRRLRDLWRTGFLSQDE